MINLKRVVTEKRSLNAGKNSNIVTAVCHWTRTSLFAFEENDQILELRRLWNNLFSLCKTQRCI